MLVHNAAVLGVTVDTGRLFDGDELYQLFVELVVDQAAQTNQRQAAEIAAMS